MGDDNVNLVSLLPSPFIASMSLPKLMQAIAAGEIDRTTGQPISRPPSAPATDVLAPHVAQSNREKAEMRQQMRETLLAKSYRTTDPERVQRLRHAAQQLMENVNE